MIYFVLHEFHRYAVVNFIDAWGRDIRPRLKVISHQDLRYATKLPRGTYVFGDVDRLTADERSLSASIADQLAAAGCRILNHPARVVWRRELAKRLEADGLSAYRCFRADEDWSSVKFPAFVRREDDHGSLERELLHDAAAVQKAIAASGASAHETLVVEFMDTRGDDGVYRKYSALRIGDRMFARHLLFSNDWVVKYADLVDPHLLAEEQRYFDTFEHDAPHVAQVARVFELANVEYGRIDYSLTRDGRVQAWEINLSPNLGSPPNQIAVGRLVSQWHVSGNIVKAIGGLDAGVTETPCVRIRHDKALLGRLGVTARDGFLRLCGKAGLRFERMPGGRAIANAYRRARWLAVQ